MNRQELKLKLVRLDRELKMVVDYLNSSENESMKAIYQSTIDYINHEVDDTIAKLDNYKETKYVH